MSFTKNIILSSEASVSFSVGGFGKVARVNISIMGRFTYDLVIQLENALKAFSVLYGVKSFSFSELDLEFIVPLFVLDYKQDFGSSVLTLC